MGSFVSTITNGIQQVADDVAGMVTDTGKTLARLTAINQQFNPPVIHKFLAMDGGTTGSLQDGITSAVNSALAAAKLLFKTLYGTEPTNFDDGIVRGYKSGGNMQTVIDQIKVDFVNWQIPADEKTIANMAKTIQTEVDVQMGGPGTSNGKHNLTLNAYLEWTVAYALLPISDDSNGIIYAFVANYVSGGW